MALLSNDLNITKKSSSLVNRPPPAKRKPIFDDDSGPEDGPSEGAAQEIDTITDFTSAQDTKPQAVRKGLQKSQPQLPPKKSQPISQFGDLSTNHSTTRHAETAQSLDPNIYDYDSVYDSLHAKSKNSNADAPKGPKYMANLFAAAEVRKRDQLRAKEKMLLKEREAEGDEFADKEKFVTEAYKAQQEEVKMIELEEERKQAKEEALMRKGLGGMLGYNKSLLEKEEQKHAERMKAAEQAKGGETTIEEEPTDLEKSELELAKEKGAHVNEEGQVTDKRQLLSAGLNVAPKPKAPLPLKSGNVSQKAGIPASLSGRTGTKQAARERQTRMLEAQLEEQTKRAADDEDVQAEAMERAAKSKKTEGDISSAKERYLQRKREAAAAKVAGKDA
ncbi:hypothetical protein MMC14_002535 [Varicellaria rhodocarpa]|nr:hypothetical protein [Varicellaria rhodocarpa]